MMRAVPRLMLLLMCWLASPAIADKRSLLILGAVPQEITYLVNKLESAYEGKLDGVPYWQGQLHGVPVVIAITGVGKTLTAMTTTLFVKRFSPHVAVMTGTGARINPLLRTGDVVVASALQFHDFGNLSAVGMSFRAMKSPDGGRRIPNQFEPPKYMLSLAAAAIEDYPPQQVSVPDARYPNRVTMGTVTTSDLFGVTEERIVQLRETFNTDIMEMESAAFALVCQALDVPYLVIRAGSNQAQEKPNDDYLVLGPIAAEQAARFTYHLLGPLSRALLQDGPLSRKSGSSTG